MNKSHHFVGESHSYSVYSLGLFGLYLRRKLEESPVFENDVATQPEEITLTFYKSSDFITKIYLYVL